MSLFAAEYLNGCLFASGLAVAAICHFRDARAGVFAASVPLFLTTLLVMSPSQVGSDASAFVMLIALSFMLGVTSLVLAFTYNSPDERRRALAASFLLGSPALLIPVTVVFYELRQLAFYLFRQLVNL